MAKNKSREDDESNNVHVYKAFGPKDAPEKGPHFAERGLTYDMRSANSEEAAAKLVEDGWSKTLVEAMDKCQGKNKEPQKPASPPPSPPPPTIPPQGPKK